MPTTTPIATARLEDDEPDIFEVGSGAPVVPGAPGKREEGKEDGAGLALEGAMDGSKECERVADGVGGARVWPRDGLERDAVGVGAMGNGSVLPPVTVAEG